MEPADANGHEAVSVGEHVPPDGVRSRHAPGTAAPVRRLLLRSPGCHLRDPDARLAEHDRSARALRVIAFGSACAFVPVLLVALSLSYHGETLVPAPAIATGVVLVTLVTFPVAAWAISIGAALLGRSARLPLVAPLAESSHLPRVHRTARWTLLGLVLGSALTVTGLALDADALARDDCREPAACYMLYNDLGEHYPAWIFKLGFWRIARAARARWGPGSVVVAPLNRWTLHEALAHGRFVFLATHGAEGDVCLEDWRFGPDYVRTIGHGDDLRLVYITACEGGLRAGDWRAALCPAQVYTFPRLSAVQEHVYWLWFRGPASVARLAGA
jgi:hypothetical protein